MKEYKDEKFCDHCQKDTIHKFRETGHERDDSYDSYTCLECHWYCYGYIGEYQEPIEVD